MPSVGPASTCRAFTYIILTAHDLLAQHFAGPLALLDLPLLLPLLCL
jgi:hypothetical protein